MRRLTRVAVLAVALGTWGPATDAVADGPEVGVNAGPAVALSGYRKTVDGDVGGTIGLWGGYRWDLTDRLAVSLIAQPQFTLMPTDDCCGERGDDVSSMFIGTAGPKLTLMFGDFEPFVTVQGGWYRDMSGLMDESGGGFNAGAGFNYRFARSTSVGVFGRYDSAYIDATPTDDNRRQFALAGVQLQHVYLPPEVPPPAPPPPSPPPLPVAKRKIVLRGVNFDFDKSDIRADAAPILDEAARTLQEESAITISVEGHTDAVGTDAYNQGLSERRADAVADYLAGAGIARGRMQVVGFGESQPVASNATPDGRAQNRRVELQVVSD